MRSTQEKLSYCIGLETAKRIKVQFAELNAEFLKQGFLDALDDRTLALEQQEINSLLQNLEKQIQEQQKVQFSHLAEENKKAGEAFLKENKEKEDVTTLTSGLQYKVLSSGDSKSEKPTLLDTVLIHYRGSLVDGKVFDSSYQRGEPLVIPLNRAIPGWSEILQLMHVGDKWQVCIPPYLAYGEMGYPPSIEPNATLLFEMELLEINPAPQKKE